jgi:hypothetical protein
MKKLFLCFIFTFSLFNCILLFPDTVRDRETRREAIIRDHLTAEQVPFTEVPLLSEYGAWGTSFYVNLGKEVNTEQQSLAVIAIPISSLNDSEEDLHGGLKFAFKYIETFSESTAAPVMIAFLADEWAQESGNFAFAGLSALLDEMASESTFILYLNPFRNDSVLVVNVSENYALPAPVLVPFIKSADQAGLELDFFSPLTFANKNPEKSIINRTGLASQNGVQILYLRGKLDDDKLDKLITVTNAFIPQIPDIQKTLVKDNIKNYIMLDVNNKLRFGRYIGEYNTGRVIITERSFILIIYGTILVLISIVILLFRHVITIRRQMIITISVIAVAVLIVSITISIMSARVLKQARDSVSVALTKETTASLTTSNVEDILKLNVRSHIYLARRVVNINIEAAGEPLRYRLFFDSGNIKFWDKRIENEVFPPYVYDSPVPYISTDTGFEFIFWPFPDANVALEISLPLELNGDIVAELYYADGEYYTQRAPIISD